MRLRACVVAFALCGIGGVAEAADQSAPPGARTEYGSSYFPAAVNWTGFYVGLNLGGGWANAPWTNPKDGIADTATSALVIGGGQLGANWQFNALVLGFEADFDGQDVYGSVIDAAGESHLIRSSWLSTLTGRVGYAFTQALLYAKGGVAFGNERNTLTAAGLTANTGTTTQVGWTAGAGIEYGFTHNWSAKIEYDFIDFPSNLTLEGPALTGTRVSASVPVSVNFAIQRLIAGINYRF
jgi:outer membrane immunogenic protein